MASALLLAYPAINNSFALSDLGDALLADYDARDTTDTNRVTLSTGNVTDLINQSGGANAWPDITLQSGGPFLVDSNVNGLDGFYTETNATSFGTGTLTGGQVPTSDTTIFIVCRIEDVAVQERRIATWGASSYYCNLATGGYSLRSGGAGKKSFGFDDTVSNYGLSQLHILEIHLSSSSNASSKILVNGVEMTETAAGSTNTNLPSQFNLTGATSESFAYRYSRFMRVVVGEGLTSQNRADIRALLTEECQIDTRASSASSHSTYTGVSTSLLLGVDPGDRANVSWTAAGGFSQVNDFSGNGDHLTLSASSGSITRVPADFPYKNDYMRFSGDASLLSPAFSVAKSTWHLIWVGASLPFTSTSQVMFDGGSNEVQLEIDDTKSATWTTDRKSKQTIKFSEGTQQSFTDWVFGGHIGVFSLSSAGELRYNGRILTTFSGTGTNTLDKLRIGNNIAGTKPFGGLIGTVLLYDGILSAADHQTVCEQLCVDYGIDRSGAYTTQWAGKGVEFGADSAPDWTSYTPTETWIVAASDPGGYDRHYTTYIAAQAAMGSGGVVSEGNIIKVDVNAADGPFTARDGAAYYPICHHHIKGLGGVATITADPTNAPSKGIMVVGKSTVFCSGYFEDLTLKDSKTYHSAGETSVAGIRAQRGDVRVKNVTISNCQQGILGDEGNVNILWIESVNIDNCGRTDGLEHGVYGSFERIYGTNINTTQIIKGHHFKGGRGDIKYCELEDVRCLDLTGGDDSTEDAGSTGVPAVTGFDVNAGCTFYLTDVVYHAKKITVTGYPTGEFLRFGRENMRTEGGAYRRQPSFALCCIRNATAVYENVDNAPTNNVDGDFNGDNTSLITAHVGGSFVGSKLASEIYYIQDCALGDIINNSTATDKNYVTIHTDVYTGSGNNTTANNFTDPVNGNFTLASGTGGADTVKDCSAYFPF